MRLLVRRAWGAHPCWVALWRGLYRAGMLQTLDFEPSSEEEGQEGQEGDDDECRRLPPYLAPAERAAEVLDLYTEALAGTAALAPISPGKGGLAWLMALRHLGAHLWAGEEDGAAAVSPAARRRLGGDVGCGGGRRWGRLIWF